MNFQVENRFTGAVQFECELTVEAESWSLGLKLGFAVKKAIRADANLAGAYLADAYLADQLKIDPADIPIIPHIDATILREIESGGVLQMSSWHGENNHWCGTTHCRAGWAIHCSGDKGKALEDRIGSQLAGTLIYHASRPDMPAPHFFASDKDALADLREWASKDPIPE